MEKWFRELREDELPTELEQGDVIESVIHASPDEDGAWTHDESIPPPVGLESGLGIVLTQSCDMAQTQGHDRKDNVGYRVPNIVVCKLFSQAELADANDHFNQEAHLETIRKGNQRAYHLIYGEFDSLLPEKFYFVSLREISVIPLKHLEGMIEAGKRRIRMLSPLRESLAFAYARSFDRVALDRRYEIPPFVSERSAFVKTESSFRSLNKNLRTAFIDKYKAQGLHSRKNDPSLTGPAMAASLSTEEYLAKLRQEEGSD